MSHISIQNQHQLQNGIQIEQRQGLGHLHLAGGGVVAREIRNRNASNQLFKTSITDSKCIPFDARK